MKLGVIHTTLGVGGGRWVGSMFCYKRYKGVRGSRASCERSFSKLKLIKTYLRSTMCQERLAILSVEKDAFDSINFDTIIAQFAEKKARKVTV